MNNFAHSDVVAALNRRGGGQLRQRRRQATSRDMRTKSQNRDSFRRIRGSFRWIRCDIGRLRGWTSAIPAKIPAKCRHYESLESLSLFLTALSRQDGIRVGSDGLFEIRRGTVVAAVKEQAIRGGGETQ
jgi:hypothetical protein